MKEYVVSFVVALKAESKDEALIEVERLYPEAVDIRVDEILN